MRIIGTMFAAAVAVLALGQTASAADCKFDAQGRSFRIEGTVVGVDAAMDVGGMGHKRVVAIRDRKRGCVAWVQARRAQGCAKGKSAAANVTTFMVPFVPVVLVGADNVRCH